MDTVGIFIRCTQSPPYPRQASRHAIIINILLIISYDLVSWA